MGSDELTTLIVNYQWRRLIADALQYYLDRDANQLTDTDYDDAKERIYLLIHDLYTIEALGMAFDYLTIRRNIGLSIPAGETVITWQLGTAFDIANPTRLTVSESGVAILTAHFEVSAGTGRTITVKIRKNGGEVIGHVTNGASLVLQRITLTTQDDCTANDYYELLVTVSAISSFDPSAQPQFMATVIKPD